MTDHRHIPPSTRPVGARRSLDSAVQIGEAILSLTDWVDDRLYRFASAVNDVVGAVTAGVPRHGPRFIR